VPTVVRRAVPADARAVEDLRLAGWRAAYAGLLDAGFLARRAVDDGAVAVREAMLADPGVVCLVAEDDRGPAGFATAMAARDDDLDPAVTTELGGLYLRPDRWRQGLGTRLLAAALAERPAPVLVLWVIEENVRARRFYERQGFRPDGGRRVLDLGGPAPEVRYRRTGSWAAR